MKPNTLLLIFCFVCFCAALGAQSALTIEDAIKRGLEKNNRIQQFKNLEQIAKAQNNTGSSGISPTVSINGYFNFANLNSHQEFNTGTVQNRPGAISQSAGASLNADWVVFDGMKMFAVRKKLELNEGLTALALKQQVESVVYDIIVSYYEIVRIKALIKAAAKNLAMSSERKKIASLRLEIGSNSRVDVLMSQSDENKALSDIAQLELQLLTAKVNLNTLLNDKADNDFTTEDSIVVNYEPVLDELKRAVLKNNSSVLFSKQNERIFEQAVKETRAASLPFVRLSGAYVFTRNQSQAGIVFLNQQNGLNAGVSAGWLLFNGNRNNRLIKEKSILALNQRLITEQATQQVDALVHIQYQLFLINKKIVALERQNVNDALELQDISFERYRIGKSGLLETLEAQKNLQDARVRCINALYALKISEAELLRANGSLVK